MKLCQDIDCTYLPQLLQPFGLELCEVSLESLIPGSFWGEPEAGLISNSLYYRADTPVHSVLHEAAHFICMSSSRRAELHTQAGGTNLEEAAVCYLQIILAAQCPFLSSTLLMHDMDTWGYSFRLGSTQAWFEQDASDAREWLVDNGLMNHQHQLSWRLRA